MSHHYHKQDWLISALIVFLLGVVSLIGLGRFDWTIAIITVIATMHIGLSKYQHTQYI